MTRRAPLDGEYLVVAGILLFVAVVAVTSYMLGYNVSQLEVLEACGCVSTY